MSGEIPAELGDLSSLQYLYLWGTELSGGDPGRTGGLDQPPVLDLAQNGLSGEIRPKLGDLTNLETLYLWGNELSGEIPAELGDLANLLKLDLAQKNLSGAIPTQLGSLTSLQRLQLQGNELTGTIPSELGDLTNLQRLYLYDNQLTGTIPAELGSLTSLLYFKSLEQSVDRCDPGGSGRGGGPGGAGRILQRDRRSKLDGRHELAYDRGALSAWHGVTTDSNGRVTRVVLSNNELTGTISVAVEQLENLEQLILSVKRRVDRAAPGGTEASVKSRNSKRIGHQCVCANGCRLSGLAGDDHFPGGSL